MTDDLTMHASMEVFTVQLYKLIEQMDKQPKERKNLISQMCQIIYLYIYMYNRYSTYHIWCTRGKKNILRICSKWCIDFYFNWLTWYLMTRTLSSMHLNIAYPIWTSNTCKQKYHETDGQGKRTSSRWENTYMKSCNP